MHNNDSDEMTTEEKEIFCVAEAFAYAARTPGTQVKIIDGAAVTITGEITREEAEQAAVQFAAHCKHHDPTQCTDLVRMFDGKHVRTFNRAEYAAYLKQAGDEELGGIIRQVGDAVTEVSHSST